MHVSGPKEFLRKGSNEILVGNIVKISTFNKDVLDSELTLISRALRFVCADNRCRMCASRIHVKQTVGPTITACSPCIVGPLKSPQYKRYTSVM